MPDGQRHSPLFGFDAGGLDDFWPPLQLALDEGVELLRRAANDVGGLCFHYGRSGQALEPADFSLLSITDSPQMAG